ncbi:Nudix hydrolase 20 [Balamuthia mandrillaris]
MQSATSSLPVEKTEHGVVVLDYADLESHADLSASIEEAFGYHGIGLLVVKNVPQFAEYREEFMRLAVEFAHLPEEAKKKLESPESGYSFGWSHGKEILKPGQFDTFKGSFYANPQYDVPTEDPEMIKNFPEVCLPNVWPREDFPQLEPSFKRLGRLMVQVGELVAEQCDRHVKTQSPTYGDNVLQDIIKESRTCKARLLHYFAVDEDQTPRTRDSWCGWHNDHGALTALCPAAYFTSSEKGEGDYVSVPCPDGEAGLWVRRRDGEEFKVRMPSNYIAYQIGETAQILSGGVLRATPHAVQAIKWPESRGITRETLAVFMQPNFDKHMAPPEGVEVKQCAVERFREGGMTFGEFSKVTIEMYYKE